MLPASSSQFFSFCQLDFSFLLGPADGRYLARSGDEDLDVIVFKSLDAPRRRFTDGRRPKRVEPGTNDPDSVPISRVTVIDSTGFPDEGAADGWLERCRRDEGEREQYAAHALGVVNRAIHAHRISARNPYERELSRDRAQAARLGYGGGDDLVEGRWRAAYTLPIPRRRLGRRRMLAPQEQLAAILSGRSPVHPSEDLALRARLDLEQGRLREAALQLRVAVDALEAELATTKSEQTQGEADALSERRRRVHALAAAALRGEIDSVEAQSVGELLDQIERTIRRRRHSAS